MVKPGRPLETWTSTETDWPRAPVRVAEETQASMPRNGRPVGGNYAGTCALDRLPAGTGMEIPSLSVTPSGTRTCPLRGVLRCDECGKLLTAMPTKDRRFYGCRKDQLSTT